MTSRSSISPRMSERRSFVAAKAKPARTLEDIVGTQKASLRKVIRDASCNEDRRIRMIMKAPTKTKKADLERRFETERQLEQNRIRVLKNDLDMISQKIYEGTYPADKLNAQRLKSKPLGNENRFAGWDSENKLKFHLEIMKKFDHMHEENSGKLTSNNLSRLDMTNEYRRLDLLNERRDVLTQLIKMHNTEAHGSRSVSSRSYSARSRAGSASSASMATFYTKSAFHPPKSSTRRDSIPKLNMSRLP